MKDFDNIAALEAKKYIHKSSRDIKRIVIPGELNRSCFLVFFIYTIMIISSLILKLLEKANAETTDDVNRLFFLIFARKLLLLLKEWSLIHFKSYFQNA